jgi:hypothetical protein
MNGDMIHWIECKGEGVRVSGSGFCLYLRFFLHLFCFLDQWGLISRMGATHRRGRRIRILGACLFCDLCFDLRDICFPF